MAMLEADRFADFGERVARLSGGLDDPDAAAVLRMLTPLERRTAQQAVMDAQARLEDGTTLRDPRQMVTRALVEATRSQLADDGRPSGEREIALELGVSRDAVRFALGKG